MKVQCSNCKTIYSFDDDKVPDKKIKVTCRKCQSPIYIEKEPDSQQNTLSAGKKVCPKCGCSFQPGNTECPKCGIIIAKYEALISKKGTLEKEVEIGDTKNLADENIGKQEIKEKIKNIKTTFIHYKTKYDMKSLMSKKAIPVYGCFIVLITFLFNYVNLQKPMNDVLKKDHRNNGIEVSVHYSKYISTSTLIYDLKSVSMKKTKADVFRVLLQYAKKLKNKRYKTIVLCFKGQRKFKIDGGYFRKLGQEYSRQNPVYLMRTFPENVFNLDGSRAYKAWAGGLLGVTAQQIEDFNDFHDKWYLNEMIFL
jgi:predicted Zn finger-like uncharacterized protein